MAKAKGTKTASAPVKSAVTRKQVEARSTALPVTIGSQSGVADIKDFSSGNAGWYYGGKIVIDGMKCQVSCSIVIVGSKDAE